MTAQPNEFFLIDPSCFQEFCNRVLNKHSVQKSTMAKHFNVDPSCFSNLTPGFKATDVKVDLIIDYLQTAMVEGPISKSDADILWRIYLNSRPGLIGDNEEKLYELNFRYITTSEGQKKFANLLSKLAEMDRPGYIKGPIWFIYAINLFLQQFFKVNDRPDFFRHWSSWHSLAVKIMEGSPVQEAYTDADNHLAKITYTFFRDKNIHRYLFTEQVRKLLRELQMLSYENNNEFNRWWGLASAMLLPQEVDKHGDRIIKPEGFKDALKPQFDIVETDTEFIKVGKGLSLPFSIVSWVPLNDEAEQLFAKIRRECLGPRIKYAAEVDNGKFHVNSWL